MIPEHVTFLLDLPYEAGGDGDIYVCVFFGSYNFIIKLIVSLNLNESEDRFDIICKALP